MRIKVTSKSFSRTPDLANRLRAAFPDCVLRPDGPGQLTPEEVAAYLADADGVVLGLDPLTATVLERCPGLQVVAKYGVGLDNVDVPACLARGLYVGWTPGVNRRSVAELALGAMLGLLRNVVVTSRLLARGEWHKHGGTQLSGKTVGVVGVGHIGKEVVELLRPFGCRILGCDILDLSDWYADRGVEAADWPTVVRESDVITLHTPLTPLTHHMVDDQVLRAMKPESILINTARGPIVRQQALHRALAEGWIAGAALDVYDGPEPPTDQAFLALPTLLCTPHIGGNAREAVLAMGHSAIDHLEAWRRGAPQPPLPADCLNAPAPA